MLLTRSEARTPAQAGRAGLSHSRGHLTENLRCEPRVLPAHDLQGKNVDFREPSATSRRRPRLFIRASQRIDLNFRSNEPRTARA